MKTQRIPIATVAVMAMVGFSLTARADQNPATDDVVSLFPYTGTLEKDGLAVSGPLEMKFTLYDGSSATPDAPIWFETQAVEIYRGRFTVLLGLCDQSPAASACPDADPDPASIEEVIRNADDLFLGVELFPNVTPIELQNRKRFLPVPYAVWTRAAADLEVARDLVVRRNTTLANDTSVGRDLAVTRNETIGSDLSVGRDLTVTRNLDVRGQVSMGLYNKRCPWVTDGICYCDNVGEFPLSWGGSCADTGHALYAVDWVTDGGGKYGVHIQCWHHGTSRVVEAGWIQLMCARANLVGEVN